MGITKICQILGSSSNVVHDEIKRDDDWKKEDLLMICCIGNSSKVSKIPCPSGASNSIIYFLSYSFCLFHTVPTWYGAYHRYQLLRNISLYELADFVNYCLSSTRSARWLNAVVRLIIVSLR